MHIHSLYLTLHVSGTRMVVILSSPYGNLTWLRAVAGWMATFRWQASTIERKHRKKGSSQLQANLVDFFFKCPLCYLDRGQLVAEVPPLQTSLTWGKLGHQWEGQNQRSMLVVHGSNMQSPNFQLKMLKSCKWTFLAQYNFYDSVYRKWKKKRARW